MGKKEAQRTKGNTKAASSARSAQILGENVGFVGFGTAAEAGFVPLLQAGLLILIRIRIRSGFNRVSGSGSGSRRAKIQSSCFEVLDGLFEI
jgi:hypothetical protein